MTATFMGDQSNSNYHIIQNIRLPRIIVGALVGINFALSGAILQGVLRNPIADPGIIGVSAGAAVASFLGAFMTILMVFHSDKVQGTINWMAGSLQGRSWGHVQMILPYTAIGAIASVAVHRHLNILMLGDDIAKGLGMRVELTRAGLIALAALLAASAVSVSGLLGFVGLITPHAFGAMLIIWADTAARIIFAPTEIPVGVFMAFLGAPFFSVLIKKAALKNRGGKTMNTIKVESLRIAYDDKEILKGLNLNFDEVGITSIIGPNGSGKSTLLKAIGRLMPVKAVAKKLAILPQSPKAPEDITVKDLVAYE